MVEAWALAGTMNIWGTPTARAAGIKVIGRSMCAELWWSKAFPLLSSRLEIFQAVRVKGFYLKDYLCVCVCAHMLRARMYSQMSEEGIRSPRADFPVVESHSMWVLGIELRSPRKSSKSS